MKHLKIEHPSVRGNIVVVNDTKQINRILANVPNFERQAERFTQIKPILKGGRK